MTLPSGPKTRIIPNPSLETLLHKLSLNQIDRRWCTCRSFISEQQSMLNIISESLKPSIQSADFNDILQTLKTHFFHRRFHSVFSSAHHLPVYVLRYVPTRVLAYYNFFRNSTHINKLLQKNAVVCSLGAGSCSELISLSQVFAALLHEEAAEGCIETKEIKRRLIINSQDLFDWSNIQIPILKEIRRQCGLSSDRLIATFDKSDLLDPNSSRFKLVNKCHLVTLMFALNELFASSKIQALKFLTQLIENMQLGAMLLILEPASDFSQLTSSNYMSTKSKSELWIQDLLDSLNGVRILSKSDSQWYRVPEAYDLKYPLEIQNARYFYRLFQKVKHDQEIEFRMELSPYKSNIFRANDFPD